MAVTVRTPRPDEWRSWRELRLRALGDAPDAFREVLAEVETRDDAYWIGRLAPRPDAGRWIAERDGIPVGMMVVALDPDHHAKAHVYAMWVGPAARGAGIGRRLLEAGLAWCRRAAALDVSLRVAERQDAATRLYRRCGFRPTDERRELRPDSPLVSHVLVRRLPPLVMGVVNVTPDSFSDGGAYLDPASAVAHGLQLAADGADILDVGGEATNPRAQPVSVAEELRRVLPVIERLVAAGATVSIDTTKAEVARAAIGAGAAIVNDVSGGLFDPEMVRALDGADVTYVAGHLRGRTLAEVFAAEGRLAWQTVAAELADRLAALPPSLRVWIDPGIGFGKGADPEGNVALIRHAGDIADTVRRPLVIGVSRKRFLRRMLAGPEPGADTERASERWGAATHASANLDVLDAASTLASLAAVRAGAQVVRVHNVTLLTTALTAYNNE